MALALTKTQMHFRPMTEADIPAVSALARKIWDASYRGYIITDAQIDYMLELMYSHDSLKEQMQNGHRFTLIEADGALLGYASVEEREANELFLHKLYVDSASQRSGLGSALLSALVAQSKPQAVSLHVNTGNWKAINFYFRQGFAIVDTHITDIGSGFVMDDFVMRRIQQ